MWLFYLFAAIVIWLGIISLRGGFRYSSYVKSQLTTSFPKFTPFASVIVPCRGLEENLSDNLAALFRHGEDIHVPGYSHFLPMEAPELVAGYIREIGL